MTSDRFRGHVPNLLTVVTLLVLTALFGGVVPTPVIGQDPDKFAQSGPEVPVTSLLNPVASKMSAESFSAMMVSSTGGANANAATAGSPGKYMVLNIEFNSPVTRREAFPNAKTSNIANVFVLTVIGRFADVFINTDQAWKAISANRNVIRAEWVALVLPPPPPEFIPSPSQGMGIPEEIVRGGRKTLTGKNVNIAILDTGIDFRHHDFINLDAARRPTSRLKYLWDTGLEFKPGRGTEAPYRYPNGASIGTLFTREQLSAELRSHAGLIPPTDYNGHGTACASIAAGSGKADYELQGGLKRPEVKGVAPDADLIGVTLGPEESPFANSFMIGAITEWLDKIAGAQPLVISGSYGGHGTAHDGQTVSERRLDARFPLSKPSRAIVFAAGNQGKARIHARISMGDGPKLVTWTSREPAVLSVYFSSNDKYSVTGTAATPINKNTMLVALNPITNQYYATIGVSQGEGGIWLSSATGKTSEADLYLAGKDPNGSYLGQFSPDVASYSYLVAAPGTMGNAITVGSYDWNDSFHINGRLVPLLSCNSITIEIGWLSCYSSPGPARASVGKPEVLKPEIVSPGEFYRASDAKVPGKPTRSGLGDTSGYYRRMDGTSAATPYTAGVIALMFEKKPALTLGGIRKLLEGNATKEDLHPKPARVPNNWGWGKLDVRAVDRILDSIR